MNRRMLCAAALAALMAAAVPTLAQGQGQGQGGRGGRSGRGSRGGFGGPGRLLSMPEVQKELKLDQTQLELLQKLEQESQNRPGISREELQKMSREEREKRFAELRQKREKEVAEILDPKQMARLKQLEVQRAGIRAIERKEVQDSLKLSADQRQKVQATVQGEREAMRQMFEGFRGSGGQRPSDEQRQAAFQKMRESRTATDTKLNGILTDAQKKQFQALQGAPFKFPERERRGTGGGRPGGRPSTS